ncbi:MAG: ammonia channel protein, partial [Nitrospirales bacterium]
TTWIFAFVGTIIILKIVDWTIGLRVSKEEEILGLDLSQHSERAYA